MKYSLVLLLALAGCHPPGPTPQMLADCRAEVDATRSPPSPLNNGGPEHDAQWHEQRIGFCASTRNLSRVIENDRRNALVTGIILGAASSALAEHNFYVYDVPRAARYLRR